MALASKLSPFILQAEGGFVDDATDTGGQTNKGVTWSVFQSYFGNTDASHHRFLVMDADDWNTIFKGEYWDKILGDKINSQKIANVIGDWVFSSGRYFPSLDTQKLINHIFNKQLVEDGVFGSMTIEILNECEENTLYNALLQEREDYYNKIVDTEKEKIVALHGEQVYDELTKEGKTQAKFLKGWLMRLQNLKIYNSQL